MKKYHLIVIQKLHPLSYTFISSLSRFHPSLTGLVVCGGEECKAMAEMTLKIISCVAVRSLMTPSLQVDLVLSGGAATSEL